MIFPIIIVFAFLLSGVAIAIDYGAVEEARTVIADVEKQEIQVLPADHPVSKAMAQAVKTTKASLPTPAPQPEVPVEPEPTPEPAPVPPPIVIVIPPAASAPAPEVATTAPPIINNPAPAQPAYMPKAPEVVLKVNGQEVESITLPADGEAVFSWSVSGESSNLQSVLTTEKSTVTSDTPLPEEGKRIVQYGKAGFSFTIQAVGKSSGLGTKKTITVTVE